jgi:osmotically-inducible protein OsmY
MMPRERLAATIIAVAALLALAAPLAAQTDLHPLAQAIAGAGSEVRSLKVIETEGIVIVRGQVTSIAAFEMAEAVVRGAGYARVANLIRLTPLTDDTAIERQVERELALSRSLEGCSFRLESSDGVLRLAGTVRYEMQKDVAERIARRVAGVRNVVVTLTTG